MSFWSRSSACRAVSWFCVIDSWRTALLVNVIITVMIVAVISPKTSVTTVSSTRVTPDSYEREPPSDAMPAHHQVTVISVVARHGDPSLA